MGVSITRLNITTTFVLTLSLLLLSFTKSTGDLVVLDAQLPIAQAIDGLCASVPLIGSLLVYALMLLCSVAISMLVGRHITLKDYTYTPVFIFMLFANYSFNAVSVSVMLSLLLFICSIISMLSSFRVANTPGRDLKSYTYLGMAIVLNPTMLPFALLWPLGMTLLNKRWRSWVASFVGMVTPLAIHIYISTMFLKSPLESFSVEALGIFENNIHNIYGTILELSIKEPLTIANIIFWLSTVVLVSAALVTLMSKSGGMHTKHYKSYILTNYIFVLSIITILFCNNGLYNMPILALPLSIILSTFLYYEHGRTTSLIYLLLIISLVASISLR